MKAFRYKNRHDENTMGWIYIGDVNPETRETTFGQLLPTDRVAHDYPSEDSDVEMMETAEEAGLLRQHAPSQRTRPMTDEESQACAVARGLNQYSDAGKRRTIFHTMNGDLVVIYGPNGEIAIEESGAK
jgi:hypothetical protein